MLTPAVSRTAQQLFDGVSYFVQSLESDSAPRAESPSSQAAHSPPKDPVDDQLFALLALDRDDTPAASDEAVWQQMARASEALRSAQDGKDE